MIIRYVQKYYRLLKSNIDFDLICLEGRIGENGKQTSK